MTAHNSLIALAHQHARQHLFPGSIAIDATVGNGHDTLFLAQHVAPSGLVYGFDIQADAIESTRCRLHDAGFLDACVLILDSHAQLQTHVPLLHHGKINAILFNLGYLPGKEKSIITTTHSTLIALKASLDVLSPTGILVVLAYPGHPGGDTETAAVKQWFLQLDPQAFDLQMHLSHQHHFSSPRLFLIKKIPTYL